MAWLSGWAANQRIKLAIDKDNIDEALTNFPALVKISDASGINNLNVTDFFDKLAYSLTGDDFTGTNGDMPNPDLWEFQTSYESPDFRIQNNKLNYNGSEVSNVDTRFVSPWKISGDYDIQVDFDIPTFTTPSGNSPNLKLILYKAADAGIFMSVSLRRVNTGQRQWTATGNLNDVQVNTTLESGKFRLVRSGPTTKGYVWTGSQWEWDGNTAGFTFSNTDTTDLFVSIRAYQSASTALNGNFDNFTINSGTVVWLQGTHPNRKKIAITQDDGTTEQKVEIDVFDEADELAFLHTKVPSISASIDTVLYLYYDASHANNTANVGDIGDTPGEAVWNSAFKGVWHMASDPSLGVKDSTSNSKDCSMLGSMVIGDLVDGLIGKAYDFDGNDDRQYVVTDSDLQSSVLTVEVVFKAVANDNSIITKGVSRGLNSEKSFDIAGNGTNLYFLISDGTNAHNAGAAFPALATWHHFVGTFDGTTDTDKLRAWLNGVLFAEQTSGFTTIRTLSSFNIGGSGSVNSYAFSGLICEVRFSNIVRPDAWIKATNESLFDDLITFDRELEGIANVIANEVIGSALFGGLVVR